MADAHGSGPCGSNTLRVQVPSSAFAHQSSREAVFLLPFHSLRLGCQMPSHPCAQARSLSGRLATLYNKNTVMTESQLFRAFGTPTTATGIRNPGYRPTYSYRLGCQMPSHPCAQARSLSGRLATLYNKNTVMTESQLFRAFGTPTTATGIRNPGYRPTYSYRLGCQMPSHPCAQARSLSGRLATLSK